MAAARPKPNNNHMVISSSSLPVENFHTCTSLLSFCVAGVDEPQQLDSAFAVFVCSVLQQDDAASGVGVFELQQLVTSGLAAFSLPQQDEVACCTGAFSDEQHDDVCAFSAGFSLLQHDSTGVTFVESSTALCVSVSSLTNHFTIIPV